MGLHKLFKRECVTDCPIPVCPTCPSGQVCNFSVKSCRDCPVARCVNNVSKSSNNALSKETAGKIAGGVVGGLVGLGILVGLFFWYKFRHRRKRHLQEMKEVQLAYESPPETPSIDPYEHEGKPPSITSTYGGTSHQSNVIPILFPFNNDLSNSTGNNRYSRFTASNNMKPLHTPYSADGGMPMIRNSIRDSEYSVDSEYIPGNTTPSSRSYDIAVQGLPTLVEVNKPRRAGTKEPNLGIITEHEMSDEPIGHRAVSEVVEHSENSVTRSGTTRSRSVTPARMGHSNNNSTYALTPGVNKPAAGDQAHTDHAAASRFSLASSTEYVADLPEEVRIYQGLGLLQ